jgi:signal transduction histidine kinase
LKTAPLPTNEKERLEALLRYDILDTAFEKSYDDLVKLAASICDVPIALISLVDPDRQWFKSVFGVDARETPRDIAFCAHAILQRGPFIVSDTSKDERFADNPLVTSAPNIRFYAGIPLVTADDYALGTLCTIDRVPRELNAHQIEALKILADQVMSLMELRYTFKQLQLSASQLKHSNASKDKFISVLSKELRTPFHNVIGYAHMLEDDYETLEKEQIGSFAKEIHAAAKTTYQHLESLMQWSKLESGSMEFIPTPKPLEFIIADAVNSVMRSAEAKGIKISPTFMDAEVMVDRHMIHSLLQNLLSNAIKYSPQKSEILLNGEVKNGAVVISVSDLGVGMTPEQISRLFQIETTNSTLGTAGETGSGLGLLIAQKYAQCHGGNLEISSSAGEGTLVSFLIPVAA